MSGIPNVWFTADLHLGHTNIIDHCNRPFGSVEEMDETLIENWNRRVRPADIVWNLGDVTIGYKPDALRRVLRRLHGRHRLILGNHDKPIAKNPAAFIGDGMLEEIHPGVHEITVGHRQHIVLCHYAMKVWNRSHRGAFHLYGHSHGSMPDPPDAAAMDVGVDPNGYAPISLDDVFVLVGGKSTVPVDHHGRTGR